MGIFDYETSVFQRAHLATFVVHDEETRIGLSDPSKADIGRPSIDDAIVLNQALEVDGGRKGIGDAGFENICIKSAIPVFIVKTGKTDIISTQAPFGRKLVSKSKEQGCCIRISLPSKKSS